MIQVIEIKKPATIYLQKFNLKKIMKKYFIAFGMSVLFACNAPVKKDTAIEDSLAAVNANMKTELEEKDSLLDTKEAAMTEFVQAFNEIHENLKEIKAKEKIISTSSKGSDLKKSEKDQIIGDIQTIYNLLNKNKQKVASLNKKLKESNLKVDELQSAIVNLTSQLDEKEAEIAELKSKLEKLNVDFHNLSIRYSEQKQESELKTEKLNTAYYVVGTIKNLKRDGVIAQEGGFIGIGKVAELNASLDPGYFTQIDITKVTDIPVSGRKVKVITPHPADSYKLVDGVSSVIKLVILEPEQFWSTSKYLIIATDKK